MSWYNKTRTAARQRPISVKGTFYHGTVVEPDSGLMRELRTEYSDWDAVWVTKDEWAAESFSENKYERGYNFAVVFKLSVNLRKVAVITKDNMMSFIDMCYGDSQDLREIIPCLAEKYDGWITTAGLGMQEYEDVAVFRNVKVEQAKFFAPTLAPGGEGEDPRVRNVNVVYNWTPYMSMNVAQTYFDKMQEST